MPICPRCALLAFVLTFFAFAGCDTNNPGSSLEEVQGTYAVVALSFDPTEPQAIADIDVLSEVEGNTRIEIFGDGNATVRFEPLGGASQFVVGTARATSRTVTFTSRTDRDAEKLESILLPPSFSLNRDEIDDTRLSADVLLNDVNLQAFDPGQYGGLTDVRGRLTIELNRIAD